MTDQQWQAIERAIAGLSYRDKLELIERLARSLKVESATPEPPKKPLSYDEINRQMLAAGLLSRLPDPSLDADDDDLEDQPVVIEGEPLSETIIRERR